MTTTPSPIQTPKFPDDRSAAPESADARRAGSDVPADGDAFAHTQRETAPRASIEEPGGKEERGMPPLAEDTLTHTHACQRLLSTFSDQLVIAHSPGTDLQSRIYAADPATGLVSMNPDHVLALSMQVADNLAAGYTSMEREMQLTEEETSGTEGLPPKKSVIAHARGMRSAQAADRHQKVVGGVLVHDLRTGGALASRLTVRPHSAIDSDMRVIGTLLGVLDIRSRQVLPPREGVRHFISRSTGVAYCRDARDPHVDRILPSPSEVDHQSRIGYTMRWLGWHITHPPKRDLLGLISEGNSGKTTFINTVRAGLGDYAQVIRSEALASGGSSSFGHPRDHNDEILHFGGGRRLVVVMEARRHNKELLNRVSGGDLLPTRPILRAAVQVTVTAGLAIVGNPPTPGQSAGAVLGIGGDDEVSAALRDRARIVRLPRRGEGEGSPPDDRGLATAAQPLNWTKQFREAALARLVEWAVEMIDEQDPPEPTPEMAGDQARLEAAERPHWRSEFVPHILTTDPGKAVPENAGTGRSGPKPADSYSIYKEYLAWHEANGGGRPPAHQRAVTDALLHHYLGLSDVKREGKVRVGEGGRSKTHYFDGYYIRDSESSL